MDEIYKVEVNSNENEEMLEYSSEHSQRQELIEETLAKLKILEIFSIIAVGVMLSVLLPFAYIFLIVLGFLFQFSGDVELLYLFSFFSSIIFKAISLFFIFSMKNKLKQNVIPESTAARFFVVALTMSNLMYITLLLSATGFFVFGSILVYNGIIISNWHKVVVFLDALKNPETVSTNGLENQDIEME